MSPFDLLAEQIAITRDRVLASLPDPKNDPDGKNLQPLTRDDVIKEFGALITSLRNQQQRVANNLIERLLGFKI